MKWPWQWFRRPRAAAAPGPSDDHDEAVEATEDAQRRLALARTRRSEVELLAEQLRYHRRENHFAEMFRDSILGRRSR